jgi:hypothetical protein
VLAFIAATLVLTSARPFMTALLPLLMFALVWLYGGILYVCLRHVVPIDPLHKTVLLGFTAYMLVYALCWGFTETDTRIAGIVNAAAFNVLMLLSAAWRSETPLGAMQRSADHFWPWRRREPKRRSRRAQRRRGTMMGLPQASNWTAPADLRPGSPGASTTRLRR